MTSGFGVEPTLSGGIPTSGTTAADIRKIWGSLYTPGIITGCAVTTSPTSMQFSVATGVVAIQTSSGEIILAPVPAATVTTAAAPGSGTRVDIVWAKQRYPDIEGDSNIEVGVSDTLPSRAVPIKKFTISAGQTNTNAAVQYAGIDYSIPYGASLGVLHRWQSTYSGPLTTSTTPVRQGQGTITVPTDRRVKFSVSALLYSVGATGFDNSKYVEQFYLPNIDGGDMCIFTTPGLHQSWAQYYWEHTINVSAGTHSVNIGEGRMVGPGTAATFYGTSGGYGRTGKIFTVEDVGPAI